MAKGWDNLRPAAKGDVRNKLGVNGHRVRQELIASILDEPDNDEPLEPGCSRIRSVVLATVRDAKAGGPGAGTAQKTCIEQYAGKARAQIDLSNQDGTLAPPIVTLNFGKKPPAEQPEPVAAETPTDGH